MEALNSYDGPGYVGTNGAKPPKRDGVKMTHREVMAKFKLLGDQALNAADFERTMHLPIGKGRLACDPETGEFDPGATRAPYNPAAHPSFPRHVHSTITEGEYRVVNNQQELQDALATRKWQERPMERRKRFTLTPEDQMQNLKLQVESERAARFELEKKMEAGVFGSSPDAQENTNILKIEMDQMRQENEALKERMNMILARLESQTVPETDEEEVTVAGGRKGRR